MITPRRSANWRSALAAHWRGLPLSRALITRWNGLRAAASVRPTVVNIRKEHQLDPSPERGNLGRVPEGPLAHAVAVRLHLEALLNVPVDPYLLVFIHVASRKVWISSATEHPDSAWVAQQARNFCMELPEGERGLVFHDSDTKFTEQFRGILRAEGLPPKKLNAFVERFIQTLGQERLDYRLRSCAGVFRSSRQGVSRNSEAKL